MSVHENNIPSISYFHLIFCQKCEFTYLSYDIEVIRSYYESLRGIHKSKKFGNRKKMFTKMQLLASLSSI